VDAVKTVLLFSRLAGYEDTNDTERLAVDPAIANFIKLLMSLGKKWCFLTV